MPAPEPTKTEKLTSIQPAFRVISGPQVPSTVVKDEIDTVNLPPSYVYGTPTPGPWATLDNDAEVKVGDVLRINYRLKIPFLQEWQSDYFVSKLTRDPRYILRYYGLNEERATLTVEVEVQQPGSPALIYAIAVLVAVAGGLVWITTSSIERLGTVQVGDTTIRGTPFLVLAGLGLAFFVLSKGR